MSCVFVGVVFRWSSPGGACTDLDLGRSAVGLVFSWCWWLPSPLSVYGFALVWSPCGLLSGVRWCGSWLRLDAPAASLSFGARVDLSALFGFEVWLRGAAACGGLRRAP